jgi:CRP-like cAMP-binding protein
MRNIEYFDFVGYCLEELFYKTDLSVYEPESYIITPGMIQDAILFIIKGDVEVTFSYYDRNVHTYKRRSNWPNMEEFDSTERMKKYPKNYRLTKKFKKYAKWGLKDVAEMIPVVGGS